jgi:hypothetical protein
LETEKAFHSHHLLLNVVLVMHTYTIQDALSVEKLEVGCYKYIVVFQSD